MKKREIQLAAVSILVTSLVAFGGAECWLRANRPYSTPDTERLRSLEYEPSLFARSILPRRAQQTFSLGGKRRFSINELGFRGKSFRSPKPQGTIRIAVIGGSAAFDLFASEGQDWPHLLQTKLRGSGHSRVEVINAAVPGHATWDLLGRLYSELWMIEPDCILVYEAWNDIKYFPWLGPEKPLLRGYRPPPATQQDGHSVIANPFIYFRGPLDRMLSHSQLYTRLRHRYWLWRLGGIGSEGLLKGPDAEDHGPQGRADTYESWGVRQYEFNLRLIAAAARHIQAKVVFLTQARLLSESNTEVEKSKIRYDYVGLTHGALLRAFSDCDAAIGRAAAVDKVPVIDVHQALAGREGMFRDHVHSTEAGSEAIASTVARHLGPLLPGADAASPLPHTSSGAAVPETAGSAGGAT